MSRSEREYRFRVRRARLRDWLRTEGPARLYSIRQGYLCAEAGKTVRVRLLEDLPPEHFALQLESVAPLACDTTKARGEFCVKGASRMSGEALQRPEWEWPLQAGEAEEMLGLCGRLVLHKLRAVFPLRAGDWEVDLYTGGLYPLLLAELESEAHLAAADHPPWLGTSIAGDPRFSNAMLARVLAGDANPPFAADEE